MTKNLNLIQFYEINICQVMILRFYTVYFKYEMIKTAIKREKNRKYYHKYSNNFVTDCARVILISTVNSIKAKDHELANFYNIKMQ